MPAPLTPLMWPPRIDTGVGSPAMLIVPLVMLQTSKLMFPLTDGLLGLPATLTELHKPVKLPPTTMVSTHLTILDVSFLNAWPASGKLFTVKAPLLVEFPTLL